ncbi:MAG: hypothetical protein QOI22_975, partial [Verrucomicrobiota bacterium]
IRLGWRMVHPNIRKDKEGSSRSEPESN